MTITERPKNISSQLWEQTPSEVKQLISQYYNQITEMEERNRSLQKKLDEAQEVYDDERRQVTVIFADISGFTALNDAAQSPAEVERVVQLVNHLLQELSQAIYEYNGYIDKYIGDEIMAIFGAPKAQGEDPELALRACLSMMERLERFNRKPPFPLAKPLGIHMGVNTGMVIAGMVGSDQKRSYTVMGDVVNVAARLEGVSIRGEIFVSETTYELTKRFFVFEKREAVQVKGKVEPLQVYQLKSAREQPIQGPDSQAPFTGREEEMVILDNLYKQLCHNQGGIITIASDAGMGKSRLVQEFRLRASQNNEETIKPVWLEAREGVSQDDGKTHPLWLFGRGLSYRRSFANRLFVDIVHSYLSVSVNSDSSLIKARLDAMGEALFGPRKPEVLPYIATMLGLTLDPEVAENLPLNDPQVLQQRMLLAMGEWLEALAKEHPLVIVFEDLHWADPSSVELIEYLFTITFYTPILLICATRLERQSHFWKVKTNSKADLGEDMVELMLWPLTDHESRQLITRLLNIDKLPKDMEGLLLRRAEGNPLFLEEMLRSLIEQEVIQYEEGQWRITRQVTEVDIPNTLQGVLTARIDRLEDEVKRVLQVAAVIGRVFPLFVLRPMVDTPSTLDEALEKLKTAELIELHRGGDEPEYEFKHVLTHETAYNSMLLGQRQTIHRRIADYMSRLFFLRGEEYAATAAEHYTKGELWDRAFKYSKRAAEAAIQSFFNRESVEFYTRSLDIAKKISPEAFNQADLLDVYYGRGRILARLGEPQQAIQDYEAMLKIARHQKDDSAEFRALNGIGALRANSDFASAVELFQAALDVVRRIGDKRGIVDTLNQLGNFYFTMGDLETSRQYYHEARDLAIETVVESGRIEAEDGLTAITLEEGETLTAIERYNSEIIHVRRRLGYRTGLIKSLVNLLRAQQLHGNYDEVDIIIEEIDRLYKKSGDYYLAPLVRYYHGLSRLYRGDLEQAGEELNQGLEMAQKQQQKGWVVVGKAWLSYYSLILGRDKESLTLAEEANELALAIGSPLYILHGQIALGVAHRRLGLLHEAIDRLENVAMVAQKMNLVLEHVRILYQLARTYIEANRWEKAQETVEQFVQLAQQTRLHEFIVRALWLQSLIDTHEKRYQTALNSLAEASTLANKTDSLLVQYLIQTQKSHLYHLTRSDEASRAAMHYARKLQQRLAELLPDEARQSFLQGMYAQQLEEMSTIHAQVEDAG